MVGSTPTRFRHRTIVSIDCHDFDFIPVLGPESRGDSSYESQTPSEEYEVIMYISRWNFGSVSPA